MTVKKYSDKMTANGMTIDKMTVYKRAVDQIIVHKMTVDKRLDEMTRKKMFTK